MRSTERQTRTSGGLPVIGWREWLALPDFGIAAVKAKVDTGARSSALHAHGLSFEMRDGEEMALFEIHPVQRKPAPSFCVEAVVVDRRRVTSSGGQQEIRPVIIAQVELMDRKWPIELTLTRRDAMGFRMLLGRQAVRRRFVVDPGRSYLGGGPG